MPLGAFLFIFWRIEMLRPQNHAHSTAFLVAVLYIATPTHRPPHELPTAHQLPDRARTSIRVRLLPVAPEAIYHRCSARSPTPADAPGGFTAAYPDTVRQNRVAPDPLL